jgi:plasmid stabilization system protein ParE
VSRRLVLSANALIDLNQIWDYIAVDSVDAADRVLDEIQNNMFRLCDMPGMGHQRPDVKNTQLRFWSVYSYLIVYRYTGSQLKIKRVISGHRNIKRLFR